MQEPFWLSRGPFRCQLFTGGGGGGSSGSGGGGGSSSSSSRSSNSPPPTMVAVTHNFLVGMMCFLIVSLV